MIIVVDISSVFVLRKIHISVLTAEKIMQNFKNNPKPGENPLESRDFGILAEKVKRAEKHKRLKRKHNSMLIFLLYVDKIEKKRWIYIYIFFQDRGKSAENLAVSERNVVEKNSFTPNPV